MFRRRTLFPHLTLHVQSFSPCCPQYTRKGNNASDGQALLDFARGLAGGAPGMPRSKYLFDAVNLPQVGTGQAERKEWLSSLAP